MTIDSDQKSEIKPVTPIVGETPKELIPPVVTNQILPQTPAEPKLASAATAQQVQQQTLPNVTSPTNPIDETDQSSSPLRPEIRPHAFVIMPFGKKKGADGQVLDFNTIYQQLIKPALIMAGFEPFRADEENKSGDILTDMFQELLLADICLVDMSIDNANVFYELGIRHAFRKRGIIHIQSGRAYMPFDVFNVRTIPYHTTADGVPDLEFIEKDKQGIIRIARATWASEPEAVHSPVFNLLTGLTEPDRRSLRTPLATGFWREYNEWKQRVTVAQRQKRIGDILLLTEEIRNPLIKEEAIDEAGRALANLGRNELALEQYRKGLEINPRNISFRRQEALHLNRLGRVDEAIIKIESLLADFPNDGETTAYLGRIYKEMWTDSWKWIKDKPLRLRTAFESYHWLLKSIHTYLKGFRFDLDECYPGINAMTLATILLHLADKFDNPKDPDPEITEIRDMLPELRGALLFALETKTDDDKVDYWTLVSLAELRVMTSNNTQAVTRAYHKALTASRRNQSFLQSSLSQLEILQALDMREEYVQAAIKVIQEEMRRFNKETAPLPTKKRTSKQQASVTKPVGNVFIFSGYTLDNPAKERSNFPANTENHVRAELAKRLDKHSANSNDLAFIPGLSAGSEIIFAELCAERGIHVEVHLPLLEAAYIREFVSPAGDAWVDRFYKIRSHPLVDEMYQSENIGEPKEGDDPYKRNNRWTLYSSLVRGIDKSRLITLWDGKGSSGKDRDVQLVKHMVDLMRDIGGQIEHINSAKFVHGYANGTFDGFPNQKQPGPNRIRTKSSASKKPKKSK